MQPPQAALLGAGDRLHLHHGPIDLIIGAEGAAQADRQRAFEAAFVRFQSILGGLVTGLAAHRSAMTADRPAPDDPVARRMYSAARPLCTGRFVTPMIAVAGSVADEVLAAMLAAVPLRRAYVNNGGDIAVHLAQGAEYSVAMADTQGGDLGRIRFTCGDGIRGIATSGARGRSQSMGIADSVSVLAASAAQADVAATLIANAVDLPEGSGIVRAPASQDHPDSDLGERLVVVSVPALAASDCAAALGAGAQLAAQLREAGHIKGAALFLQGHSITEGYGFGQLPVGQSKVEQTRKRMEHADV